MALNPLVKTLVAKASPVVILHNGLLDATTESFLDANLPEAMEMVTSNGATLLTPGELAKHEGYNVICHATGPGASFVFPRKAAADSDTVTTCVPDFVSAIPGCRYLGNSAGQLEQFLKLSVNIALNGTLAHKCLAPRHSSEVAQPVRVVNHEMQADLPLAMKVAELVLLRASLVYPENNSLLKAVEEGTAAERTEKTLALVPNNTCSTVVDVMSGRRTERSALLDAVLSWPLHPDEGAEAAKFLGEIDESLRDWDNSVE
jgi:hypothetical protein